MAANSVLQTKTASGNGATRAATFDSACTPGSLIIAIVTGEDKAVTQTVADGVNAGNYTQDLEAHSTNESVGRTSINSISNGSSSALTVTVTFSASRYGSITIIELYNSGGTPALDSTGTTNSDAGNAPIAVSITTTTANCTVVYGATHYPAFGAGGPDSGYTSDFNANLYSVYHSTEHNADVGAAGTKTLTWNGQADGKGPFLAAAYTAPSGGGDVTTAVSGSAVTSARGTQTPGISIGL